MAPALIGAVIGRPGADGSGRDGRYAIGVPRGWDGDNDDGVLSLTPPGRLAEIRIFNETGAESDIGLAEGARGFLADQHNGAQIGRPQRVRVGSVRGLQVTATYGGGEEIAIVLTRGGFSFWSSAGSTGAPLRRSWPRPTRPSRASAPSARRRYWTIHSPSPLMAKVSMLFSFANTA